MSNVMSHKLEDLQAKTNKLVEEVGQSRKTRLPSGERREDRGDEDTQPAAAVAAATTTTTTTTTTVTNHHQQEKSEQSCLFHLHTYLGSIVSTTGHRIGTDEDVKASQP
ncbi:unnamed protein product [Heterobilharzia americana]|nr:unnamed protein product [Heterobilharzia americana]